MVNPETYSVEYVHTDALGSPVAYTGSSGSVLPGRSTRYEPYGTPTMATRDGEPSYTGHQYDASTGLIYAQQRYYDPMLGRFLGVDPMAVDTGSAFNWNRYAYANNNPYRFTDPDGRETKEIDGVTYESREHEDPKSLVGHDLFLNPAGKAECVELVKQTVGGNASTQTWRAGESVSPETPVGTAVGTFNEEGTFDTKDTGQHAAILTEPQGSDGSISVADQWKQMKDEGKKVHERTIPKDNPTSSSPSNNAKEFRVILFKKEE